MAEKHNEEPKAGRQVPVGLKKEDDGDSKDNGMDMEYTILCDEPRLVLDAIISRATSRQKCANKNIINQLSEKDKEHAIATHFPYCWIDEGEKLIISTKVEETQNEPSDTKQKDEYSVFYIDSQGGKNTRSKQKLFFRKLCTSLGKIYDKFPYRNKFMEKRFSDDSFQNQVALKRENFGKIQQSFTEIHIVNKLVKLRKSVCKVVVDGQKRWNGTGFVLFHNFVLTSGHLFEDYKEGGEVVALFNYDDPEPYTNYCSFKAKKEIAVVTNELDYAVLELDVESQTGKRMKMPPGLLKKFSPVPEGGETCLIGHPGGGLKQMDRTCIITKENRAQVVDNHLEPHRDTIFTLNSIRQVLKDQGIDNILIGGTYADKALTYNTNMYHGSSGSPVFDASCRVIGLHSGGFWYGFIKDKKHVIQFGQPLLTVIKDYLGRIMNKKEVLDGFKKEMTGNKHLETIFESVVQNKSSSAEFKQEEYDEPMDID